ncbi:hypothetical protein GGI12_003995 [Dipsacomyces acuminosporus]|nr:hypothetical protein GGI12_003995 [Dipsacomyces acuminosporus]
MFPALSTKLDPKFNDWEYWKNNMPSIDDELAIIEAEIEAENQAKLQQKQKQKQKNAADSAVASGRKSPLGVTHAQTEPALLQATPQGSHGRSPSLFTRATRAVSSSSSAAHHQLILGSPPSGDTLVAGDIAVAEAALDSRQRAESWATDSSSPSSTPKHPIASAIPGTSSGGSNSGIGIGESESLATRNFSGASNASNATTESSTSRISMLKKVNVFSSFSLVRGSSPPPPSQPQLQPQLQADASPVPAPGAVSIQGADAKSLAPSLPGDSGTAFPALGGSPPSDQVERELAYLNAAGKLDFASVRQVDFNFSAQKQSLPKGNGAPLAEEGEEEEEEDGDAIADDPAIAAAASRLIPQIPAKSKKNRVAKIAADAEPPNVRGGDGSSKPQIALVDSTTSLATDNFDDEDSEYSDEDDVDSELDDDDDEDELDQETLAIMHDLDEIQYL